MLTSIKPRKLTREQRMSMKPWELPFHEYKLRDDAINVSRLCSINVDLNKETEESLSRLSLDEARQLAKIVHARISGNKQQIIADIFRIQRMAVRLKNETVESLMVLKGKELKELVTQCGLYKGGNKYSKAGSLVNWVSANIEHRKTTVARAKHYAYVKHAVSQGLKPYDGWEHDYPDLVHRFESQDLVLVSEVA